MFPPVVAPTLPFRQLQLCSIFSGLTYLEITALITQQKQHFGKEEEEEEEGGDVMK